MLMQLNKPADQCTFILSNFVKRKKTKINADQLGSRRKQFYSISSSQLFKNSSRKQILGKASSYFAMLPHSNLYFIYPTWTEMSRVQSGIYSVICITEELRLQLVML